MEFLVVALVAALVANIAIVLWSNTFRRMWPGSRRYIPLVFGLSFIASFVYGAAQL